MEEHPSNKRNFDQSELPHYDKHGKATSNQYAPSTRDKCYAHLISHTTEVTYGCFTCWEPQGPGFDDNPGGYKRFSAMGKKHLCHKFSWTYHHNDATPTGDISHRCGNKKCCRPSHLEDEERTYQRTRDDCPGWVHIDSTWIKICMHQPHCMKGGIPVGSYTNVNPDI